MLESEAGSFLLDPRGSRIKNFSLWFWEAVNIVSLCSTCGSWFSREALHSRTSPGDTRKLQEELPPVFDTCYFFFNLASPKAKDSSVFSGADHRLLQLKGSLLISAGCPVAGP